MVASVSQLIGKINPKRYAGNWDSLLKKYGSADKIPADKIAPKAEAEHVLVYDSGADTLEPIYFFILDLLNDFGLNPEKLNDNFSISPGSASFGEMGQRTSIMQQQGSKLLGDINMVLRSILNLIYDLRDFKTRLQSYKYLKSKDKAESHAAKLSLKQIWMDKVDISKGNSAIKAMGLGQAGFSTLIDLFLSMEDEKTKIDTNDRVKRILIPRIQEFNIWLKESENELEKRYSLEKNYLRSQVSSLKMYVRWAKPYFKAAQELEQQDQGLNADLVKAFNTTLLELTLMGKHKVDVKDAALSGDLPQDFSKDKMQKYFPRNYHSCILLDFYFRGQKVQQQSHLGRTEVTFRGYALNDDELAALKKEMDSSDLADGFKLIEGATTESLEQLEKEANEFLDEDKEKEKEEKKKDTSNPFAALFGIYDKKEKKKKDEKKEEEKKDEKVKSDSWHEKSVRKLAAKNAGDNAFLLFDIYKKAHGMSSFT